MDSYEQKISHLKALYYLACSDSAYNEAEAIFIKNVAQRLGVDIESIENFSTEEPDLVLPDREYKLYSLFHRLAIIIMIDNEVNEIEKKYCFDLGIKMGLHPNAIEEVIEYVIDKGTLASSPKDIIGIFKKYMN